MSKGFSFRKRIAAFICLALLVVATSLRAATAGALQYEALPLIRSNQNHLLVHAELNGKPALLGVDTGHVGRDTCSLALVHSRSQWRR